MIDVTRPFLPPLNEVNQIFEEIWSRNWLTNNGPVLKKFEISLSNYFKHNDIHLVSSGTIGLQIALKALNIKKTVITTPFSYVATTSSIAWEGCIPKFVDIDPKTLNVDVLSIEKSIDNNTEAILVTHCFGNPCNINEIDKIAKRNNLKVIYDSAQCFGTEYNGKSIFHYGDISVLSLHATKICHMVEGGAIFANVENVGRKVSLMRNFGHDGPENFNGVGINGKNSEIHSAIGLVNLRYINDILAHRKKQVKLYNRLLNDDAISTIELTKGTTNYNFSYFPIILKDEDTLLNVMNTLKINNIGSRRYFYPSLSKLNYIKSKNVTPISDDISRRILCLPLYHTLSKVEQKLIIQSILKALR